MDEAPVETAPASPAHGESVPRGLAGGGAAGQGRFGRMFPALAPCDVGEKGIEALVRVMDGTASIGENPRIPAGFTYLGQFIDHDITFDPNSQLDQLNDPAALVNFRSPRLDLDSVYGSGPADQPFLYNWTTSPEPGVAFLISEVAERGAAFEDLPRNREGRALIGDPRNDVHAIIAQLHLLFLRFHNRVVEFLCRPGQRPRLHGSALFTEACRLVRWHYQWIVVHDFLPRVVGDDTMRRVFAADDDRPRVERRHYRWEREPFIPVEFSGAAYRFGHSMVRGSYRLRPPPLPVPGDDRLGLGPLPAKKPGTPVFAAAAVVAPSEDVVAAGPLGRVELAGFRDLSARLRLDWGRFFDVDQRFSPQRSMKIDQGISSSLTNLPHTVASAASLPLLNLRRGRALGLPSGQAVARAMGQRISLSADALFPDGVLGYAGPEFREQLVHSTPLWYYLLAEAASAEGRGGEHLGPVGGRIVAEVLLGIIEGDAHSYMSQAPAWTPELPRAMPGNFTMADLVHFTNGPAAAATPA